MHKLLAFDTSTDQLSVAVRHGDSVFEHQGAGGAQASSTLIPLVLRLLAEAGLALGELDAIVFGRGPGSFTGLRTACAVAQGLGFGAGVLLLPVDTLLAVAEEAHYRFGASRIVAVLDARMEQVYTARHSFQARTATSGLSHAGTPAGAGTVLECNGRAAMMQAHSERVTDADSGIDIDIAQLLAPEQVVVPPGWVLAGNAFAAYGERLAPAAGRHEAWPTAAALLRLAPALLAGGRAVAPAHALPFYVRDKVAQTTEERAAVKAAAAASAATPFLP